MKKFWQHWRKLFPDLCFVIGVYFVTEGVKRIYEPAGLITFGLFAILFSFMTAAGGESK